MLKFKDTDLIIKGKRIYLREIRISDANQNYLNWMRDYEVNRYLESRFQSWTIKKLKAFIKKIKNNPDYIFWAVILKENGRHIGNIKLGPIDSNHGFGDIGIIIGEKAYWGKGLATEAIKLAVSFAFNKLKLHKLTAGSYVNNIGSIKAFENAGFFLEGIRKKQYFYKGRYKDSVLLGIVRK